MSSRTLVAPPRADNSLRAEFGGRVRAIAFVAIARVDAFHVSTLESARSLYTSRSAWPRCERTRPAMVSANPVTMGTVSGSPSRMIEAVAVMAGDKVDVRRRDHGAEPAHRRVPGYEARRGGD